MKRLSFLTSVICASLILSLGLTGCKKPEKPEPPHEPRVEKVEPAQTPQPATQAVQPQDPASLSSPIEQFARSVQSREKDVVTYGSFNACNLGQAKMGLKKEKKGKKPLQPVELPNWKVKIDGKEMPVIEAMARMYRYHDIIAIQEVSTSDFGAKAVYQFRDELNRLGKNWDVYVSDKTTGDSTERYAILVDTSKCTILGRNTETGLVKELQDPIEREPLRTHLKVGNNDLWIYNFHLVPTAKNPIEEAETVGKSSQFFNLQSTIISGDFNLSNNDLDPYFEKMLGLHHNIEAYTSLGNVVKDDERGYFSAKYDNIYTSSNIIVKKAGVFDFVPLFKGANGQIGKAELKEALKISDHDGVFAQISFKPHP